MVPGDNQRRQYGLLTDLTVSCEESDLTLMLGGTAEGECPWSQVLTQRAAQLLWFKLTVLLYPEKSDMVTGLATTAPLRAPSNPDITTHVEVAKSASAQYTLVGWMQRNTWKVLLSEMDARRLWTSLDMALFPVGWEGRRSGRKTLN
jgi:hypothetical protein